MGRLIRTGIGAVALAVALTVSAVAFAATAKPSISSFTPSTLKAGATVTITGKNLTGASSVTFDGTKASSLKVVSATKITAMVPSNVQAGKIGVTTKDGTATSSSSFKV